MKGRMRVRIEDLEWGFGVWVEGIGKGRGWELGKENGDVLRSWKNDDIFYGWSVDGLMRIKVGAEAPSWPDSSELVVYIHSGGSSIIFYGGY